jgi:hypothetical protein
MISALRVDLRDLGAGEVLLHDRLDLGGRGGEGADVVDGPGQLFAGGRSELEKGVDGVGHRHEGDPGVGAHEAGVGLAGGGGVDHLGGEVRGPARRDGEGRDEAGEADRAEVDLPGERLGRELLVVAGVVAAELLAVELVAAVHRRRIGEVVLLHPSGLRFHAEARHAVGRDRRRIHEDDRPPVRLALPLGELEHRHGPLDVHLVRRDRGELAPRGEERREVKYLVDLELGEDPFEELVVEDRARELPRHPGRDRGVEGLEVERDDGTGPVLGEPLDERVADFSAGPGEEDDRCAQHESLLARAGRSARGQPPTLARAAGGLGAGSRERVRLRVRMREESVRSPGRRTALVSSAFLAAALCTAPARAQRPALRVYGVADGLKYAQTFCVAPDRDGMIWAGTSYGVSRYDGKTFASLTARDGLPHDSVKRLAVSGDGTVWAATQEGLARIAPAAGPLGEPLVVPLPPPLKMLGMRRLVARRPPERRSGCPTGLASSASSTERCSSFSCRKRRLPGASGRCSPPGTKKPPF